MKSRTVGTVGNIHSPGHDDAFLQGVRALPTLREFLSGGEYSFGTSLRDDAARAQKRLRDSDELEDDELAEYFSGNVAEFSDPPWVAADPALSGMPGAVDASLKRLKPAKRSRAPQER